MRKVKEADNQPGMFFFHCPGCGFDHGFNVVPGNGPAWEFNNDLEKPTVSPSIRVRWPEAGVEKCCHSYVKDGYIQFLNDCTHGLADQTVELEAYDK